ncbi:MAG: maleylpyruvate isomerase N-terminal domain-containing protein, partial [Acidimicrobiia bacterium]
MDEILGALAAQHAELGQLLTSLEPDDWTRDTPCEGWTVADVVVHLAQTDELAIGSVQGRFTEVMVELAGDIGF